MSIEWCAGFLDGEGSFCLTNKRNTIVVWQNTKEPLDALAAELGGNVYGPYTREPRLHQTRKPFYQWHLKNQADLFDALDRLIPHLIVKQAQAGRMRSALLD